MAFILRVEDVVRESVPRIVSIGRVSLLAVATLSACDDGSSPIPTDLPTNTPAPSKIPTQPPSDTLAATPVPKVTPEPTATLPVPTPEPTPTQAPTVIPTLEPTPTQAPTATPTPEPTATNTPTVTPTPMPVGHSLTNPIPPGETVATRDGLGITIVSATLDATSLVLNANRFNDPPTEGNRFTILRVRVQNIEGSVNNEINVGESDFRLVGSSATLFSPYEHSCGVIPDELSVNLFKGGAGEGNVCFQVPEAEYDMILFYEPLFSFNGSDRRWLQVADPDSIEPLRSVEVSLEPTPDQSPGHFRTNPIPPGETVTTRDGLGITIVSATLDATSLVLNANRFNDPPTEGNRFTILRVRVQNIEGSVNNEINVGESDFRLVGSSATLFSPYEHSCGVIPDELSVKLFKGGAGEGNVCFQVPEAEYDIILFYEPLFSFNGSDRRWLQVADPDSIEPLGGASLSVEEGFTAISNGDGHTCVLRSDGSPLCWGNIRYGVASEPAGEKFIAISSGHKHTCALRSDGSPLCWGSNLRGQASPPAGEKFTSISSGFAHNCALRSDDSPVCWGSPYWQTVTPSDGKFTSVSSGYFHTCALHTDGSPICWGNDERGQASPPAGERFSVISSGYESTCALRSDGSHACWGGTS